MTAGTTMMARGAEPTLLSTLDLSGPAIRSGFNALIEAAGTGEGVESYLTALQLKVRIFRELLADGRVAELDELQFLGLCTFMSTVRRRAGPWLADHDYAALRQRMTLLLGNEGDVQSRFDAFVAGFPKDRQHRWLRDLGAELLHFTAPDSIPLMTRWIWDADTRSGVLREIWFDVDPAQDTLTLSDRVEIFLALRNELEPFLRENGIYRDHALMQDLLCAHIYARYINDRGSTYLKGDFVGGEDPMAHTRRLLGLDCCDADGIRMKVKLPDAASALSIASLQLSA